MTNAIRTLLLLALLGALLVPGPAHAASGSDIRGDCAEDGVLDRNYSASDLRKALRSTPSNEDEYAGDCRQIIERALQNALGGRGSGGGGANFGGGGFGGGGNGGGGGLEPTAEDRAVLAEAASKSSSSDDAKEETPIGEANGRTIAPEISPALARTDAANEIPLPVTLALLALAALTLVASSLAARRRLPDVIRVTRRTLRR